MKPWSYGGWGHIEISTNINGCPKSDHNNVCRISKICNLCLKNAVFD